MKRYLLLTLITIFSLNLNAQDIGDGGPAKLATLQSPSGIAIDKVGNVYIAERSGCRIRKIDHKTGIISTIAGTGERGFSGDNGPATEAQIAHPELISLDSQDNLIITDRSNSRIRKINTKTGIITTIAGNGKVGYNGDNGPAIDARISYPFGVLVSPDDNIYIADTENHVIRMVDQKTGLITTIAGNGKGGFSGDGGLATKANLSRPHNFIVDKDGNLIIGDSQNQRIRRVNKNTGKIETLYGKGEIGFTEDGESARNALFGFFGSFSMYEDKLLFSGWINKRIRIVDPKTHILSSIQSNGAPLEVSGPYGIAVHGSSLYVSEANKHRVLKVDLETGNFEIVIGK